MRAVLVARAKSRCTIVVFFGDARVAVIEKRAGEVRIFATIDGGGRGAGSSEQMGRDVYTDRFAGELRDQGAEVLGGQLPARWLRRPRARGCSASPRQRTARCVLT